MAAAASRRASTRRSNSTPSTRRKPRPTEVIKRLVWARAACKCAFPDCRAELVEPATASDRAVTLGEIAHIVGHSEDGGPRAGEPIPGGDREGEANLMLLCLAHHTIIDQQANTYTVPRLVAMKADHERWVREVTSVPRRVQTLPASETVHSTFLSVDTLPRYVYVAPCLLAEKDIFARIRYPRDRAQLVPCIVREKQLISFTPIDDAGGVFDDVVSDRGSSERHDVATWLRDEDQSRWIVDLLNRAVRRALALRGLWYDKEHRRFFFPPEKDETGGALERSVRYRAMNQPVSERKVAWNPVTRQTGLGKRYWIHLAVGLRFHRVSPGQWVLTIRPERRFTTDGLTPLAPKRIGQRSTSLKSRMFNHDLLSEVHFWKEFLTEATPRWQLSFGSQSLVIDGTLMSTAIAWPGVPDDVQPFRNVDTEDDLFTSAAFYRAMEEGAIQDAPLDEIELDDLNALEVEADDDALSDEDFEAQASSDGAAAGGGSDGYNEADETDDQAADGRGEA